MNTLLKSLDFILNKGFCATTHHRAEHELKKIKSLLTTEEFDKLHYLLAYVNPDNPDMYVAPAWKTLSDGMHHVFYERELLANYVKTLKTKYGEVV